MSVPVKLPTTSPIAPQWKTATKSTIAATVISTFATLAIANCGRALLDAEERRQLLVVRLRPQPDRAGAHEPRVVAEAEQCAICVGEDEAEHEPERRHRHREPERRADHGELLRVSFASK